VEEKKKWKLRCPELNVNKAHEDYEGCTVDEIFKAAADGELTIYVKSGGWKVDLLCSINTKLLGILSGNEEDFSNEEREALLPGFKNVKNQDEHLDFLEKFVTLYSNADSLNPKDYELEDKFYFPPYSIYKPEGMYRAVYVMPLTNILSPLSPLTIQVFHIGTGDHSDPICLKFIDHKKYGVPDNPDDEFFIIPDPAITVQEALETDMLVVMKADLDELIVQSPDDVLHEMFDDERWPEELGMAIAVWRKAREVYKLEERPRPFIEEWLRNNRLMSHVLFVQSLMPNSLLCVHTTPQQLI